MGDQRAGHALFVGVSLGAASLSDHGARIPIGDREGGTGTNVEGSGPLARYGDCLCGRWVDAIGIFSGFLEDEQVELIGVEAGGSGIASGRHAARFGDPTRGRLGVIHGTRTYVLQDEDGQIADTHSISAGLDYAAVGPEHAMLRDAERAFYTSATDEEALAAFSRLCKSEGIIPALESSHAVAEVLKRAPRMKKDQVILVNLSGRGDKDLNTVIKEMDGELIV